MKIPQQLSMYAAPGTGLGLFRIMISVVYLVEVCQLFIYRHLIFDAIPYVSPAELRWEYPLLLWILVVLALLVGFQTRLAAVANYCFSVLTFGSFTRFEYHVDWLLISSAAMLIVMPVGQFLSVDEWFFSRNHPEKKAAHELTAANAVSYACLVVVGPCLLYLDSAFWKLSSPMWTSGLGVWVPASLPGIAMSGWFSSLVPEWAARTMGMVTLVFEILFPFLVWNRYARPVLVVIGVGLHLGILAVFPIPMFSIAMLAYYIPVIWLGQIRAVKNANGTQQIPRREVALPFCVTGVIVLFQLQHIIAQPGVTGLLEKGGLSPVVSLNQVALKSELQLPDRLLGCHAHAVFLDNHFVGHERLVALVYSETDTWLPLFSQNGTSSFELNGRLWAWWAFRAMPPSLGRKTLENEIRRCTAFWLNNNGGSLDSASFDVMCLSISPPRIEADDVVEWTFQPRLFESQLASGWKKCGEAVWEKGEFSVRGQLDYSN